MLSHLHFPPRTLSARLMMILLAGLLLAHLLSFWLVFYERTESSSGMMLHFAARDIGSSVAILDRLPAAERPQWLEKLARRSYRYRLEEIADGVPLGARAVQARVGPIVDELGPGYRIESSRNRETGGTGLGLAIAAQLTQQLQGTLSMRNRDSGGLEVRVTLPRKMDS